MLKPVLLSVALIAACGVDSTRSGTVQSSSSDSYCPDEGGCPEPEPCECDESCESCDHECDCECPPEEEGPSCEDDGELVFLDSAPANLDDSDGKVTFCHATSSARNPWVVITTSISACEAHEDHVHLEVGGNFDIFPTGGCAD